MYSTNILCYSVSILCFYFIFYFSEEDSGGFIISVGATKVEKTYMCPLCSYFSNQAGNLRRHVATHTGQKPHICSYCKKAFALKQQLQNHMRRHTGEKPYSCAQCGKSFSLQSNLRRHEGIHLRSLYEKNVYSVNFENQPE